MLVSRAPDDFMHGALPTELWLYVCDFLRPADRVAISQTCRLWRDTALNTRSLWTAVEFVATRRYDGCPPGHFRAEAYTTLSNLPLLREVLLRSERLPLAISLHVHFGAEGVFPALVAALAPHAERLVALRYRGRTQHVSALLDALPRLPSLRALTTDGGVIQPDSVRPFVHDATRLPSLEHLELSERLLLPASPRAAAFPALRSLAMAIPRMGYIRQIVAACPSLQSLRLNLRYVGEEDACVGAVPGSLIEVLRPVSSICFSGLTRARLYNVLHDLSTADIGHILRPSRETPLCNATLRISAYDTARQRRQVTLKVLGSVSSVTL